MERWQRDGVAREGEIRPKPKVLVLEDNFLLAGDVCDFLRHVGFEPVGPAHRVDVAARLMKEQRVDAAVLDIMLGDRACFPICSHLERWNVPFVFLTGSDTSGIPDAYRHVPLLTKPYDRRKLKEALGTLVTLPVAA